MNYTCIFFGVVFIVAGIAFACGKVHIHLSAWKNMALEDREKIRILPLCRNIGTVITLSGILFLLNGISVGLDNRWFTWAMIVWLILAGIDVRYIGKSSRYRNQ